jgi:hypothetical protein
MQQIYMRVNFKFTKKSKMGRENPSDMFSGELMDVWKLFLVQRLDLDFSW